MMAGNDPERTIKEGYLEYTDGVTNVNGAQKYIVLQRSESARTGQCPTLYLKVYKSKSSQKQALVCHELNSENLIGIEMGKFKRNELKHHYLAVIFKTKTIVLQEKSKENGTRETSVIQEWNNFLRQQFKHEESHIVWIYKKDSLPKQKATIHIFKNALGVSAYDPPKYLRKWTSRDIVLSRIIASGDVLELLVGCADREKDPGQYIIKADENKIKKIHKKIASWTSAGSDSPPLIDGRPPMKPPVEIITNNQDRVHLTQLEAVINKSPTEPAPPPIPPKSPRPDRKASYPDVFDQRLNTQFPVPQLPSKKAYEAVSISCNGHIDFTGMSNHQPNIEMEPPRPPLSKPPLQLKIPDVPPKNGARPTPSPGPVPTTGSPSFLRNGGPCLPQKRLSGDEMHSVRGRNSNDNDDDDDDYDRLENPTPSPVPTFESPYATAITLEETTRKQLDTTSGHSNGHDCLENPTPSPGPISDPTYATTIKVEERTRTLVNDPSGYSNVKGETQTVDNATIPPGITTYVNTTTTNSHYVNPPIKHIGEIDTSVLNPNANNPGCKPAIPKKPDKPPIPPRAQYSDSVSITVERLRTDKCTSRGKFELSIKNWTELITRLDIEGRISKDWRDVGDYLGMSTDDLDIIKHSRTYGLRASEIVLRHWELMRSPEIPCNKRSLQRILYDMGRKDLLGYVK
ncbi:uncharacterized protein LOC144434793 [Glandiceps talaboti]